MRLLLTLVITIPISRYHILPFLLSFDSVSEPQSYIEAQIDAHWQDAVNAELSALIKNQTWDLIDLSKRKKVIGC